MRIKWPFLFLAIFAVACMMLIGISIAYQNVLYVILSILAFIFVMGAGFSLKKKWRESGRL